jgi:hypothetical protein
MENKARIEKLQSKFTDVCIALHPSYDLDYSSSIVRARQLLVFVCTAVTLFDIRYSEAD